MHGLLFEKGEGFKLGKFSPKSVGVYEAMGMCSSSSSCPGGGGMCSSSSSCPGS